MQQLKLEGKVRKRASLSVKERQTTKWEDFAHQAGVPNKIATQIKRTHRMAI